MRIAEINMMNSGSTGKIMFGIAEIARKNGDDVWTFSPRNYQKAQKNEWLEIKGHNYFGSVTENKMHLRISQDFMAVFPGLEQKICYECWMRFSRTLFIYIIYITGQSIFRCCSGT